MMDAKHAYLLKREVYHEGIEPAFFTKEQRRGWQQDYHFKSLSRGRFIIQKGNPWWQL
jgi:hypothetical protein